MAVVGIMMLFVVVSLPSLSGVMNQAGRKTAINQLLNVFEQTRVSALETGVNTYLLFANNSIADSEARYRAFVVYRDPISDRGETTLQPLTKWIYLPRGISFVGNLPGQTVFGGNAMIIPSGHRFAGTECPAITFAPTGAVSQPGTTYLKLFLFEGFPLNDGSPNYTSPNRIFLDKITLSRFTGRAQVDLAELP
jgi:hypothetical protein